MDWTQQNVAEELRWFFQEAASECGIRSTQAGFEAQMEARSLTGRPEAGDMVVRETRSSRIDDGITDRRVESWRKAREIHQRLAQLSEHDRRVLEMQFGCAHTMGDVSLSLVAAQKSAIAGHQAAATAARKAEDKRRLDLARRTATAQTPPCKTPSKPKRSRLTGGSTVRDWILYLCASEEGREHVEAIMASARVELRKAVEAYVIGKSKPKRTKDKYRPSAVYVAPDNDAPDVLTIFETNESTGICVEDCSDE